ncbi:MAG TPA: isoprenylcysteine carboxylmethyltransferase family protein [Phycisphaerae bacterium]|nr:isoprenylcysteine carboxylmethyltransferase family protein [Phycisphaerae bacterium]
MLERIPPLIAAVCLTIYWGWVLIKLVRLSRKIGKDPNALPREPVGILMRIFLWYPCVIALLAGLWLAALAPRARLGHMTGARLIGWLWAPAPWWWIAASIAAALCVACTVVTFVCWRKMGRSWRIGIDPNETLVMVTSGPYRMVRHPIYALRMVINVCVIVMAPTLLVVLAAGLDFVLLQIEARREERYMEATHGQAYARYKNSVGRFVPRTFVV